MPKSQLNKYKKFALTSVAMATMVGPVGQSMAQELEEIVVTAQRRAQSLLDVPVAVSAYSAEALAEAGVDDMSDLNSTDPSFMATPFLSDPLGNAPVRVRGIGTGGGNPGFEGAVGLYVDDVYRSRTGSAMLTFFDMEGVEILRGPQGTLFGKNTTAGALVQRTAAPVIGETFGKVTAEVGNYGQTMIEAMYNKEINDTTALRVAVLRDEEDGWFQHPVTFEDTFWRENTAIRASIAFEPSDTFSGRVTVDHSTMESPGNYGTSTRLNGEDNEGNNARQTGFGAFALNLIPGAPGGAGYWYWDLTDPSRTVDPYSRDIANSQNGEYELKQTGLTANLEWELNDNLSLRSITGYRQIDSVSFNGDWDFGPTGIAGGLDQDYEFDSFSQEFLLSGSKDLASGQTLDFTAGVNYFTEDLIYDRRASVGPQFAPFYFAALGALLPFPIQWYGVPGYNFQNMRFDQTEDSYGAFGHLSFEVNDAVTLVGGLRYNKVDKELDFDNLAAPNQDAYHDLSVVQSAFFYAVGAALTSPDYQGETSDEEWTYNAAIQVRPTDASQIYFGYSRGFKAGGFNLTENLAGQTPGGLLGSGSPDANGRFFTPASNPIFGPEFVDSYELGFRYEWDAARIGVTVFSSDFEDLQVAAFNGLTFEIANAGTSKTEGVELEGEWAVSDTLTLKGGATLLEATYGDEVEGFPAGRQRGQVPETAIVVGARYVRPLADDREFYFNGNVSYSSEVFLAEGTNDPLRSLEQDAYTLVSASMGLRAEGNWDVSLFCNNCFDEDYYEWGFNQPFHDAILVNPAPPATYGARFTKNF